MSRRYLDVAAASKRYMEKRGDPNLSWSDMVRASVAAAKKERKLREIRKEQALDAAADAIARESMEDEY